MKFINLLKKELAELLTIQSFVGIFVMIVMFMVIGGFMKEEVKESVKAESSVSISDRDDTEMTRAIIQTLKENGAEVKEYSTSGDDYAAVMEKVDGNSVVIIPEGFTEAVNSGKCPELISVAIMESSAALSNISNDNSGALSYIKYCVSNVLAEKYGLNAEQINLIHEPTSVTDQTVIGDKYAAVSTSSIMGKVMIQNMFMPIIVAMLILMTSQTLMNSVSSEKIDKTLETLLSAPVSRMSILLAKMLAAAIFAMINAAVYMVAFSVFMGDISSDVTSDLSSTVSSQFMSVDEAMERLGLVMSTGDYVLVGVQLFLTIMICLAVSMMLGALVTDPKQSQTLILPVMFMAIIPYMISMLADINSLPIVGRIIIYLIPFTHTFSAIQNVMFGHMGIFYIGLVYQIAVFAIVMFFAMKLFNSDKILTISLNLGQKSKYKKKGIKNDEE